MECILCADTAWERKYFFKDEPLCTMHYAEYLEVLVEEIRGTITSSEATSAFEKYETTLEPTPLSESRRTEKAIKEREKEAEKKKSSQPAPKPYRDPFSMGM